MVLISGLSYITISDRYSKKQKQIFNLTHQNTFRRELIVSRQSHEGNRVAEENIDVILGEKAFYTELDQAIMTSFTTATNKVLILLQISVPAFVSMGMCTLAIMLCYPLMSCLWPTVVGKPNINVAITCFLAPAGMVYALTFGFMYHQVKPSLLLKHNEF